MAIIKKLYEYTYAHTNRVTIDLTLAENPLGPAPKVMQAIANAANKVNEYPREGQRLIELLAKYHKIDVDNIMLGAGANQLIEDVFKVYALNAGIVMPSATFPEAIGSITTLGGYAKTVPLKGDFSLDLEGLLSGIEPGIALIHLCNPNNPTGIWHKPDELLALADRATVPLFVSEVGTDFIGDSLINYDLHPNIIVVRSFSKSYGLAGLRIGYVVAAKERIVYLKKRLRSYSVNSLAIAAAIAALEDQEYLHSSIEFILKEKAYLMDRMSILGFEIVPSQGQTFIAKVPKRFSNASDFCDIIAQSGIAVINCSLYEGLEQYIRVSPQKHEVNEKYISILARILRD